MVIERSLPPEGKVVESGINLNGREFIWWEALNESHY
jgi:hypothetical protein